MMEIHRSTMDFHHEGPVSRHIITQSLKCITCLCFRGITWLPVAVWYYGQITSLHWRDNDHDGVSNHRPHGCLLNRLFKRRSKKASKLRVIGLCVGDSPGTGEFPAQMASNAENVSIWWRHHVHDKLISYRFMQRHIICLGLTGHGKDIAK